MSKTFGLVEEKLAESDFFLEKIAESGLNLFEVRCYFSAFVSSARSVTFALQFVMSDIVGFKEWYSEKQQNLKADLNAKFFHAARNESQHTGVNPVSGGSLRNLPTGEKAIEYYFTHDLFDSKQIVPETDVVSTCRDYMKLLVRIVRDCYQTFGSVIDSAQHYTAENMAKLRLSIEDVEESLGFPRDWTANIPDKERIRLLRGQFPEPEIDRLFEKYLGLNRFGNESA